VRPTCAGARVAVLRRSAACQSRAAEPTQYVHAAGAGAGRDRHSDGGTVFPSARAGPRGQNRTRLNDS
jgi:hypothetical protein